jgi:hypothetical protein
MYSNLVRTLGRFFLQPGILDYSPIVLEIDAIRDHLTGFTDPSQSAACN